MSGPLTPGELESFLMSWDNVSQWLVVPCDVELVCGSICNDAAYTPAARTSPILVGSSCIESAMRPGHTCTQSSISQPSQFAQSSYGCGDCIQMPYGANWRLARQC